MSADIKLAISPTEPMSLIHALLLSRMPHHIEPVTAELGPQRNYRLGPELEYAPPLDASRAFVLVQQWYGRNIGNTAALSWFTAAPWPVLVGCDITSDGRETSNISCGARRVRCTVRLSVVQ